MGVYGPRTVFVLALKDAPGCHEFLLQDDGKWLHVKETTEIGERHTSVTTHTHTHARVVLQIVVAAATAGCVCKLC
jgi:hypothetical protein